MKKLAWIAVLGALTFATAAQAASNNIDVVTISGTGQKITVPSEPYHMSYREFEVLAGDYDLANGQVLSLTKEHNRMYASLARNQKSEIVAASPTVFVSRDAHMKIAFQPRGDGDMGGAVYLAAR